MAQASYERIVIKICEGVWHKRSAVEEKCV